MGLPLLFALSIEGKDLGHMEEFSGKALAKVGGVFWGSFSNIWSLIQLRFDMRMVAN